MTNRFDVPQAGAPGAGDTTEQDARQAGKLELNPTPEDFSRPGQGAADVANGGGVPRHLQAFPTAPNYRRSLFRR